MTFDEYSCKADRTRRYGAEHRVYYPALGLAGEAGEVCNLLKKVYRDRNGDFGDVAKILEEMGDVLWYLNALAADLGIPLSLVAERNIEKLKERYPHGTT